MKRFLPLLVCIAISAGKAVCQDNLNGSSSPSFLPATFYKTFNIHLPFYSGRIFNNYSTDIKGQALFPEDHWAPVTLLYEGLWYNTVGRYDRYADELLIRNPDSTCVFILNRDRISRFLMEGRTFVKLNETAGTSLNGYYEMVADGKFAVFIKRSLVLDEDLSGTVVQREFLRQEFYYVRKNDQFYQIRTKNNLFALISERKREIQQALRIQKLKYKKEPEATLKVAAGFYK